MTDDYRRRSPTSNYYTQMSPQEDEPSSSEYSLPYSDGRNDLASPEVRTSAYRADANYQDDHRYSASGPRDDVGAQALDSSRRASHPESPAAEEENDFFPSSDEDCGSTPRGRHGNNVLVQHQAEAEIDFSHTAGRRGKKGLSHAELAMLGHRAKSTASRSEETEDEDEERPGTDRREEEPEDIEVETTKDDWYPQHKAHKKSGDKSGSERRRSLWSQYPPVVSKVARMLEARGVKASDLGYARLVGAGRGTVDFLVRKQSVLIGRLESAVDCLIKTEAQTVSRRHARLYWENEREEWVIACLSEKNCIVVNGIPLVPGSAAMPVKSRDLIEIGDVAFFFLAATSPVFFVNNIPLLETTIRDIRNQEERAEAEEDRRRHAARLYGGVQNSGYLYGTQRPKSKDSGIDRKRKREEVSHGHRSDSDRNRRSRTPKKKAKLEATLPYGDGWEGAERGREKQSLKSRSVRNRRREGSSRPVNVSRFADGGETEDEDEKPNRESAKGRTEDDSREDQGTKSPARDPFISNYNVRVKKNGTEHDENGTTSKHREEWNKKERSDFARALFAVGVDPIFAEDGSTEQYDWKRFRKIAELPKKSDLMLEDYYIRVMGDVRSLLEEEEQEKRTKGPRTKHKPGCDCVVCENTRKSRRKKREQREGSRSNNGAASEMEDDVEVKSTAKSSDKLVGLVTAQKLRVRLSIHEAARNVKSEAGEAVFAKLDQQRDTSIRDFPQWWRTGYHDKALMRGTGIHGVGQWSDIWHDPRLKAFRKAKDRHGGAIVWPSNQAAMKRVRDLASAINAELRREAKRAAKEDRNALSGYSKGWNGSALTKSKRNSTPSRSVARKEKRIVRKRAYKSNARESGGEYETVHNSNDEDDIYGEGSTNEGGSDGDIKTRDVSQIETEDEEDVEVEVEEEMEIVEEEDDQEMTEEEDDMGTVGGQVASKQPAGAVADISTDDEEDEDNIQYETASDSGSE